MERGLHRWGDLLRGIPCAATGCIGVGMLLESGPALLVPATWGNEPTSAILHQKLLCPASLPIEALPAPPAHPSHPCALSVVPSPMFPLPRCSRGMIWGHPAQPGQWEHQLWMPGWAQARGAVPGPGGCPNPRTPPQCQTALTTPMQGGCAAPWTALSTPCQPPTAAPAQPWGAMAGQGKL